MSAFQKPRADAKLKTLPVARQAEIAELLRTRRIEDVAEILRSEGLRTSANALSEFHSWWHLQQSAFGAQIVDLTFQLRQFQQRLNRRDYATERQATQARAAMALLRDDTMPAERLRAALKQIFGIK